MEHKFSVKFDGTAWIVDGVDTDAAFYFLDVDDDGDFQIQCDNFLDQEWVYVFGVDADGFFWYDTSTYSATGEEGDQFEAEAVYMAFNVL